jgi:uncharacterized protein (DUF4415 family)
MKEEYDFTNAKTVGDVPALTRLQAEGVGKARITIRIDNDILDWFRAQVAHGGSYQSLMNAALRAYMQDQDGALERTMRRVIREELRKAG